MLPFYKKYLEINLSDKSFKVEKIDEEILKKFGGGKGIGTYLLYKLNPVGVDPLSPGNHLIINTGPAVGNKVWGSSRYGIYTKSPLTNCYLDSTSGGKLAKPISRTGYDAIVIKGASNSPIFLEISDEKVSFNDASDIWGKDTYESEDLIKERVGVKGAGVCVIGPAGESLVNFAVVENDYWRSIGRGGIGAIFGSKKLKGIAFYGKSVPEGYNNEKLNVLFKKLTAWSKTDPSVPKYKKYGTAMGVALLNEFGAFPTKFWNKGKLDGFENITAERLLEVCNVKSKACPSCFIACGDMTKTKENSRYPGIEVEGPEYETLYTFGGLCCITDIEEIVRINDICDRLGLDTITAGNLVALALQASEMGLTRERFEFGNAEDVIKLLYDIAFDKELGTILKKGIVPASKHFGIEDLAIHNKGLEPAGYDPRALPGTALGYAVSSRGGCHLRSGFYKAELSGVSKPDELDGKAELVADWEDRFCMFDTLILCRFFRDAYMWDETVELFQGIFNDETITKEKLKEQANMIISLAKKFNIRENPDKVEFLDTLPKKLFEQPLENGKVMDKSVFHRLIQEYYKVRNWDERGVPAFEIEI